MVKHISVLLVFGCLAGSGCSNTPSQTLAPAAQNAAARAIVDGITGNARGAREEARALRSASDALAASKDYNGAMEKRLQMLELRGYDNSALGALTAYAIQGQALDHLARIASYMDAASSRKYADQLKAIDAKTPTYAALLQWRKADEIKQFDSYLSKPGEWAKIIAGLGFSASQQAELKKLSPAQIKANLSKLYDARIKRAGQPYTVKETDVPVDPYTQYVSRDWGLARFLWTKNKMERLFAIMALERKTDHTEGHDRVGPLPADPFGSGPFKESGGYVYSVGPDTKDNGGAASPAPEPLRPTSQGDVVMPLFSPRDHSRRIY